RSYALQAARQASRRYVRTGGAGARKRLLNSIMAQPFPNRVLARISRQAGCVSNPCRSNTGPCTATTELAPVGPSARSGKEHTVSRIGGPRVGVVVDGGAPTSERDPTGRDTERRRLRHDATHTRG